MNSTCILVDSRDKKRYEGRLSEPLSIGKTANVIFPDEKRQFSVVRLQRYMSVGNKYWLVDGNGVRFLLVRK